MIDKLILYFEIQKYIKATNYDRNLLYLQNNGKKDRVWTLKL